MNSVNRILERLEERELDVMPVLVLSDGDVERARSILREITKTREIDVVVVDSSAELRPRNIYVLPFGCGYEVHEGRVFVQPSKSPDGCVSQFFRCLGNEFGARSIAIDLTQKSDSLLGLKAVRERGGFVLAEAGRHSTAVESIIRSNYVDGFVSADQISRSVSTIVRDSQRLSALLNEPTEDSRRVAELLRDSSAVGFDKYKPTTIMRRVQRRMAVRGDKEVCDYFERLENDPDERDTLASQILIGVTAFFRDPKVWGYFESGALAEAVRQSDETEMFRAWVPGCSTGPEAFSLAIAIYEAFERLGREPNFTVFASDVSRESLQVGKEARYPLRAAEEIPPARLKRWFRQVGDRLTVNHELREKVVFCEHDIIRDSPFSEIDVISCQNVFIYLTRETQREVLEKFHWSLDPNGLLWLAAAESITAAPELWEPLDARLKVFEAVGGNGVLHSGPFAETEAIEQTSPARQLPTSLTALLCDVFAPKSVLVDHNLRLVDSFGDVGLVMDEQNDSVMLVDRLLPEFRRICEGLVNAVCVHGGEHNGLVETDVVDRVFVNVRAIPAGDDLVLVSFIPQGSRGDEDLERGELMRELDLTRDALKTAIESGEDAVEEAFTSNEELIASNEELNDALQELHARQTELTALNDELTALNDELIENQTHLEALIEERTRTFRMVCDNSLDLILRVDADNRILFANARVEALLAGEAATLTGQIVFELDVDTETLDELVRYWDVVRDRREPLQFVLNASGEQVRELSVHAVPEFDDDGRVTSVLSIGRDITARRKAEAERQEMRQRLQEAEHLESLALMAGGVAHDFNNILVGILGLGSLVREGLDDGSPLAEDMDDIIDSARLASNVANQLLAYAGMANVSRSCVSLADVTQELLPTVRARFAERVNIEVNVDEDCRVNVDRTQLSESLTNLLTNACEATVHKESPTVTLYAGAVDIEVDPDCPLTPEERDQWIRIEVRDNGSGVPKGMRARIFDPFFSSKQSSGRGLGLAMVKGFVNAHGGLLSMETETGSGTVFRIYLERSDGAPTPESTAKPLNHDDLDGVRVLAVDDEPIVRNYLRRALENVRADVVVVESTAAARAAIELADEPFDLVHIDLSLPDGNGIELLEEMRAEYGDIPAVVFSGYDSENLVERVRELPGVAVLQKPADPATHLATVLRLCGRE